MDANKLTVLRNVDYKIEACELCIHGKFNDKSLWGVCNLHRYNHLKHDVTDCPLSIIRNGSCTTFTFNVEREAELHEFNEFVRTEHE